LAATRGDNIYRGTLVQDVSPLVQLTGLAEIYLPDRLNDSESARRLQNAL
jgi:hypothetical protein